MKKIMYLLVLMIITISAQLVTAQTVTIATNPNPADICAGSGTIVSLTANPTGGIVMGYSWSNGGNTQTINVSPLATTPYTVTVTFLGGFTATASQTVTVLLSPTPTITAGGSLNICIGNSVTLTSSAAASYQWYLNGTIILGATLQTYSASTSGSYQVFVTVGTCTGMSLASVVTANPLPTATVTPLGPLTTCWGTPITLTAAVGVGYNYQWQMSPNGLVPWTNIIGETNQTTNINTTGYYRVQVIDANGCVNYSL